MKGWKKMRNNQAMQEALRDARTIMQYHDYGTENLEDAEQKQSLYDHLSNLQNWDESKLRLSVNINDTIYKLEQQNRNVLGDMIFNRNTLVDYQTHSTILIMLSEILRYNLTRHYDFLHDKQFQQLQIHAKEVYNLNIRDNIKPSKLVGGVFKKVGINEDDTKSVLDYLSCYAPSATERCYYISINPLDYLTMSNGNSWRTCQELIGNNARVYGVGCYGQGCLSLWLDESTAILYEESSEYDALTNNINYPYKRGRRLLNYGNNGILIQKGYGDIPIAFTMSVLKAIYPYGEEVDEYDFNQSIDIEGAHYDDYGCNSFYYRFSQNLNIFSFIGIQVGSEIHCVGCGHTVQYYDEIVNGNQCEYCKKETCSYCGCEIDAEDAISIDCEIYCPNCVETCEDCGDYFLASQLMEVGEYMYCESCAINNAIICQLCGVLIHIDDSHLLDNGLCICDDCMDNYEDDETE